jgi:hypothetical protein
MACFEEPLILGSRVPPPPKVHSKDSPRFLTPRVLKFFSNFFSSAAFKQTNSLV